MAELRLSTGSRMLAWPGWAWAAKVEGSICMSPRGVFAGLPPAAAVLAAAGLSDDSCWAMDLRLGAHDRGAPVRARASEIQVSTGPEPPGPDVPAGATAATPPGPAPIAVRRAAANPSAAAAGAPPAGTAPNRWQISATRASMAMIPSMPQRIGARPADLSDTKVNPVRRDSHCCRGLLSGR